MRVILRSDVEKLGRAGEAVEVAAGYARNYLLPRQLAYPATPENERRIAKERKALEAKLAEKTAAAQALSSRLAGLSVTVQAKTEGETLYGSVGPAEIVSALEREHGLAVPAEAVRLAEPIKKVGTHDVTFRLAEGAEAAIKVWVLPEEPDPGTAEAKNG